MNVLGLHLGHDAAAALIVDDRLVAMIERERLTKVKSDRGFSLEMVDYVLREQAIELRDIDCVAVSLSVGGESAPCYPTGDLQGIGLTKNGVRYFNGPRQLEPWPCEAGIEVEIEGITFPGYQVQHQIAHIASSFYLSGYETAIGLAYDGSYFPDDQTSLVCECRGNRVERLYTPQLNAGLCWDQVTRRLFGDWRQAGKLLGLAAYGSPAYFDSRFLDEPDVKSVIYNHALKFPHDMHGFESKAALDAAASAQYWLERDLARVHERILRTYPEDKLVVAGGCALNVVANRQAYERNRSLFIPPFCTDSGQAVGGALYVLHHVHDRPRQDYRTEEICFLGNGRDGEAEATASGLDLAGIAREIADGAVVFWHQGRSEAGPRALTHRSVLAEPFRRETRQRVSEQIKGREAFRPLAPIVSFDSCLDYFEIKPGPLTEMMLLNAIVKDRRLEAIMHVDGTARVQSVSDSFNPLVSQLLREFEAIRGVPVLVNTSLNIRGEPICDTEQDTLRAFEQSGADLAVVNGRVHRKSAAERSRPARSGERRQVATAAAHG